MNESTVGGKSAVGQMNTFAPPLVAIVYTITKLQKSDQNSSSNSIIDISPPGGKKSGRSGNCWKCAHQ